MAANSFGVLGAGRQGTAAAYDIAVHQGAGMVTLLDADAGVAAAAAERIDRLAGRAVASWGVIDASDEDALQAVLAPLDLVVCALPYVLIPTCTRAAIAARTSMVDLGGNTDIVLDQLKLDPEARSAGIVIVPDCGMGPGLNNTLGMYLVERLEAAGATPIAVRLYDGGLPQDRSVSWGYRCTFHIDGLTNEYDGDALFLRDGRLIRVPTLSEVEPIEFAELGTLEAFVTSGGTSTVPYTLEGRLETYENKTLRYPGHLATFRAFRDLGLFRREPIRIDGTSVSPREVYHALLAPQIGADEVVDVCVLRAVGNGRRNDEEVELRAEIIDKFDPVTRFSAMERLTGWHAAIMAGFVADGSIPPGAHRMESAVPATAFVAKVRERGIVVDERWQVQRGEGGMSTQPSAPAGSIGS